MPKRVNNIYVKDVTFSKLLEAHNKCKKHKRFKKQVIEFTFSIDEHEHCVKIWKYTWKI